MKVSLDMLCVVVVLAQALSLVVSGRVLQLHGGCGWCQHVCIAGRMRLGPSGPGGAVRTFS